MSVVATTMTRTMPVGIPSAVGRLGIGLMLLAACTATWGSIALPMGGIADLFLCGAIGLAGIALIFGDLRFKVPWWVFVPPIAILFCVIVRQLDATPYYLRVLRYQITYYKPESVVKGAFWIFALLAVPLAIIACTSWDSRVPRWVMGSYVGGVVISSLVAGSDLVGFTHLSSGSGYASNNLRQPGLTEHPNTLGFTCAISIPFVVYFISTMRQRWIPLLAFVVILGGVAASGSRGAQAMVPICLIASFIIVKDKRAAARSMAVAIGLACAAGITLVLTVLPGNVRDDLFRFGGSTTAQDSNTDRLILVRLAIGDFSRYPLFGAGIRHVVEAHNIYLQLLAAGGILLAAAMLVYWGSMLWACRQLGQQGVSFAYYLMVSIVTWLILGSIENQLTDRHFYYTVGCIAALVAFNARAINETHLDAEVARPRRFS